MPSWLPVQPGQQILGGADQFDHGGEEFIGGLIGIFAVVGGVLPALRHGAAQVVVRCSHLPHQSLQVVRLHAIVLLKKDERFSETNLLLTQLLNIKTTLPISTVTISWLTNLSTSMLPQETLKEALRKRYTARSCSLSSPHCILHLKVLFVWEHTTMFRNDWREFRDSHDPWPQTHPVSLMKTHTHTKTPHTFLQTSRHSDYATKKKKKFPTTSTSN